MTAFRTETVDTPAGTYTVELHFDEDSENPLTDWDHEGMAFYVTSVDYSRTHAVVDTMEDADRAGDVLRQLVSDHNQDEVERRYRKWAAITGSPWVLVTGSDSSSRSDFYRWYVLVKGIEFTPSPAFSAHATMSDYRKWAAGEVCGYVTKSPDGNVVESVWGFYDDDEALEQGNTVVKYDWQERLRKSWTVGAGFVGIV